MQFDEEKLRVQDLCNIAMKVGTDQYGQEVSDLNQAKKDFTGAGSGNTNAVAVSVVI